VKSRYFALAVFPDDFWFDDEWDPVIPADLSCFESKHREAPWKTRNTTKYRFERLGKMMGDKIFEDLNGGDPRLPLVSYACLAANAHNHLVVVHAVYQISKRIREDFGVRVHL